MTDSFLSLEQVIVIYTTHRFSVKNHYLLFVLQKKSNQEALNLFIIFFPKFILQPLDCIILIGRACMSQTKKINIQNSLANYAWTCSTISFIIPDTKHTR